MDNEQNAADAAQVREGAYRFLSYYSHGGKVFISITEALQLAATVVGASRSLEVLNLVREAAENPATALENLQRSQNRLVKEIDADRQKQMRTFAETFKADCRQ